jgi:hypothetical protein
MEVALLMMRIYKISKQRGYSEIRALISGKSSAP